MNGLLAALERAPLASILQLLTFIAIAIVGGVLTIDHSLDIEHYLAYLTGFSFGNGLLGVGRGLVAKANGPRSGPSETGA